MGFSKVHNSYSINNNPNAYKFLTSILLVQISYSKRTNMAFHSHLSAINNLGTLNHSMVFSSHFQASNNHVTLKHSTVLRSHFQASNNLSTLKHSTVLRIRLQASNNLGTLKHSMVINIKLLASSTIPICNYSSHHPVGSLPEKDKVYLEISETVSIGDNVRVHCTDQRIA